MNQGIISSISISKERGQLKKEIREARAIVGYGIESDGHAGDWGRQITCLNRASVEKVNREKGLQMGPGDFAENILIDNLDFSALKPGSRLAMGTDVILEVTQIGKEDHPSVVSKTFGVSLLPYEGLFCKVISGGTMKKGDRVEIIQLIE